MKTYRTDGGTLYRFEKHALDRMAQRDIKRSQVKEVLDNYGVSHTDTKGNPCFIGNLPDGKRLRVVVEKDSNPLVIITVVVLG